MSDDLVTVPGADPFAVLADVRATRRASAVARLWRGDPTGRLAVAELACAAEQVADRLERACATVEGARAMSTRLRPHAAEVAMWWAEVQAARGDLALAPLIDGARGAGELRARAAAARVAAGPLRDAGDCIDLALGGGQGGGLRPRIDALCWELAARGTGVALGAAAIDELVLGDAGDFGKKLRAARALLLAAESMHGADDLHHLGLGRTNLVLRVAATWLAHPESALWSVAARAIGRLAGRLPGAWRIVRAWAGAGTAWQRRRIGVAIAAMPAGLESDAWIEDQLALRLAPDADRWETAALPLAATHLARERGELWQRLLDAAPTATIEVAWSLAHGISALARRGARTLAESDREAARVLRDRFRREAPRSTEHALRTFEIDVLLAWALGEAAPSALPFEAADDAIRAVFDGRREPPPSVASVRRAFEGVLGDLDALDEAPRGRAHAIMRSSTRALAARIHEVVRAAPPRDPEDGGDPEGGVYVHTVELRSAAAVGTAVHDAGALASAIAAQLAKEVCEYGLRTTAIACLGDLVDGEAPGPAGGRGRAAARTLRAVAASRWAREDVAGAADDKARAKAVKKFKKPLDDLFDRLADVVSDSEITLSPPVAAWWTLCGDGAALAIELQRGRDDGTADALRALERSLRDAAQGASPERWLEGALAALARLGAQDTALARVIERIATALDGVARADDQERLAAAYDELAAATRAYLEATSDLDGALSRETVTHFDELPAATRGQVVAAAELESALSRAAATPDDVAVIRGYLDAARSHHGADDVAVIRGYLDAARSHHGADDAARSHAGDDDAVIRDYLDAARSHHTADDAGDDGAVIRDYLDATRSQYSADDAARSHANNDDAVIRGYLDAARSHHGADDAGRSHANNDDAAGIRGYVLYSRAGDDAAPVGGSATGARGGDDDDVVGAGALAARRAVSDVGYGDAFAVRATDDHVVRAVAEGSDRGRVQAPSIGAPRAAGSGSSERDRVAEVAAWERELPAVMRPVIAPVARGLAEALARRVAPAAARVAGARIGPFELLGRLGGGGMGEVWKARRGRQLVALKLPHGSAEMMEVLRAEASRLEGLSIAKVVTFIEAGVDDGVPFLATHYLRGRTWFEHALGDGAPRIDLALARRIARDVCTGLANLHELRIVHRDVTPKNVFLRFRGVDPAPIPALADDPQGRRIDEAVLIDLGVAQHLGDDAPRYMSPGYAAPELLRGHAVGPAADVYALAATLFHVLTGRRFAHGLSRGAAAAWHLGGDPFEDGEVRAAAAHLPSALRALLADATRLDPARRPSLETFDAHLADP